MAELEGIDGVTNKGLIGRGAFGSVYLVENDAHEQVNRWSEKSGHFPSVRFLTVCKGRTFKLEQYRVYLRGEEGWGVGGGGSPPRPIPSSPQQYSMQSVQVLYIKPYIMAQQILKYSRNPLSPPPPPPPPSTPNKNRVQSNMEECKVCLAWSGCHTWWTKEKY